MSVTAIVVGGGSSSRMKGTDKLTLPIGGMTVFERSVRAMAENPGIDAVVAVARKDLVPLMETVRETCPKLIAVREGGASRCLSVKAGLRACPAGTEFVAIHDAARPFVSQRLITAVLEKAKSCGAAAPALPVTDTVKTVDAGGAVTGTPDRNALRAVQTPQIFLLERYAAAAAEAEEAFDDCQIYEKTGYPVYLVDGEKENIKITTPEDAAALKEPQREMQDLRIGHGYDVHRLMENRKLILGGEEIPYEKGLLGHSDADVLLHALADALLGAAGLRDIGFYFPDNDPAYEGADSRVLLRKTVSLIRERGYVPANADMTVICQRPKLSPYIEKMKMNIAADLGIAPDRIGLKATTEEKLGFTGEGLGISAHAVVTITRI